VRVRVRVWVRVWVWVWVWVWVSGWCGHDFDMTLGHISRPFQLYTAPHAQCATMYRMPTGACAPTVYQRVCCDRVL